MMKRKCFSVIFIAVVFLFVITLIQEKDTGFISKLHSSIFRPYQNAKFKGTGPFAVFHRLISTYRSCLSKNLSEPKSALQNLLSSAIDGCLEKPMWKQWNALALTNTDEQKWVILPSPADTSGCVEVTLGVGNDTLAEEKLRQLVPNCKFFGADPIYESGEVFTNVGVYFQLAVSAVAGVEPGEVLENGHYFRRDITTIALADFLKLYVNVSKIDYLWIDNEGAEYKIFPKYFITNTLNITICQINVEMHMALKDHYMNQSEFDGMIRDIVAKSPFLPVLTDQWGSRSFYINVVDDYCVEKFLLNRSDV